VHAHLQGLGVDQSTGYIGYWIVGPEGATLALREGGVGLNDTVVGQVELLEVGPDGQIFVTYYDRGGVRHQALGHPGALCAWNERQSVQSCQFLLDGRVVIQASEEGSYGTSERIGRPEALEQASPELNSASWTLQGSRVWSRSIDEARILVVGAPGAERVALRADDTIEVAPGQAWQFSRWPALGETAPFDRYLLLPITFEAVFEVRGETTGLYRFDL